MTTITDRKEGGDAVQCIAKRSDGSVRQIIVQDSNNKVIGRGFFPPGTMMEGNWVSKVKYHWIDAWSDEELLDPENNLIFTKGMIDGLRSEAVLANLNKSFVIENLENYKRNS